MTKDEILDRIQKGEQYLNRTDLTDKQRENAGERYSNLVALLAEVCQEEESVEEKPEPPEIDPKVQECMNKIREILDQKKVKR